MVATYAIKNRGVKYDNLCVVNKTKPKKNVRNANLYLLLHFNNKKIKRGNNNINAPLALAVQLVKNKNIGDTEKTNVARNAERSSLITILAIKKIDSIAKIDKIILVNKMISSIEIPVTVDMPDKKKGYMLP